MRVCRYWKLVARVPIPPFSKKKEEEKKQKQKQFRRSVGVRLVTLWAETGHAAQYELSISIYVDLHLLLPLLLLG
jgi:hypothetical protein